MAEPSPVRAAASDARDVVTFEGTCDASGAVELDDQRFMVADDENNVLRVYDALRGGRPLLEFDVSRDLALDRPDRAESDFEAATRLGERAFFLASHGRTAKGKRDPNRMLFFATDLPSGSAAVSVRGKPYRALLHDLVHHPTLSRFELGKAAELAPKAQGGLNIEGLTAEPNGTLLFGFRSPLIAGKALLVRVSNANAFAEGEAPRFSEPLLVDLGGLGVRALTSWRSKVWIIAGPPGDGGPFRIYRYDGQTGAEVVPGLDFTDFGPEGFFTPDTSDRVLVLSDDGTRPIDGRPCKKLKDPARKRFRGVWVTLPK